MARRCPGPPPRPLSAHASCSSFVQSFCCPKHSSLSARGQSSHGSAAFLGSPRSNDVSCRPPGSRFTCPGPSGQHQAVQVRAERLSVTQYSILPRIALRSDTAIQTNGYPHGAQTCPHKGAPDSGASARRSRPSLPGLCEQRMPVSDDGQRSVRAVLTRPQEENNSTH
ncbi:hypothetical protein BV25DRAFT_1257690 [Artomyces pyxidatus]|uniref:Uncharacterized protein n=1 Tax=Artomyces pyxidatus TaxID=48021 RepID=A0ACB8TES5_9AGAM|nr:hypothetical protein BV25DRAFT_1257690 [Artomyces pyxidatus]